MFVAQVRLLPRPSPARRHERHHRPQPRPASTRQDGLQKLDLPGADLQPESSKFPNRNSLWRAPPHGKIPPTSRDRLTSAAYVAALSSRPCSDTARSPRRGDRSPASRRHGQERRARIDAFPNGSFNTSRSTAQFAPGKGPHQVAEQGTIGSTTSTSKAAASAREAPVVSHGWHRLTGPVTLKPGTYQFLCTVPRCHAAPG